MVALLSMSLYAQEKIYKVGDYYNEKGKQGIVFEVSEDGLHGKIVSLDCTKTCWNHFKIKGFEYRGNSVIGANSLIDGKQNTDKVLERQDAKLYSAFLWCREKGEDWYLPAQNELVQIYEMKKLLNETLESVGGEKLSGIYHWTSTEGPRNVGKKSYALNFAKCLSMNFGALQIGAKSQKFLVRAVATF